MADKEVLGYVIDVDTKKGVREAAKFQREMDRQIGKVSKSIEKLGKTAQRVSDDAADSTEDWIDNLGKVSGYYSNEIKEIRRLDNAIEHLKRQRESADDSAKKGIDNQIKALAKQLKRKKTEVSPFDMKAMGTEAKKGMGEAAKDFKETMRSFFQRDIPGMLKGGGGIAKSVGKMFLSGIGTGGVKLRGVGTGLMNKPGAGKATALAGKSLKAVGGAMGKMGSMVSTLSKLGPVIGGVTAALMAVVQVMIDADAKAKKFQKSILESASTAEFMAGAAGDTALAYEDLSDAMKSIRDAAFSWENIKWGISSDEHVAVISTLTQEGVSIKRITQEAAVAKKEVGEFASELTHVSVAYSRAFGVSLQEVTKFQGEMMTDLGMGLEDTRLAFAQMTRSATESGIAANRFFTIIRGVSQDLSLYNVRMGSAVKLLKMLGKVMNPRNAAKFMQQAAQGLKNMGQDERLKVALLAGNKGKKIVEQDLQTRRENLYRDIGKAIGEQADAVRDQITSDPKALWDKVQDRAKEQLGTLRESSLELNIDENASKKGVYGQAFAMENLGMGSTVDMMRAALSRFGGGNSLMEGAGNLGMTKMSEMLGMSTQQLRGMMKLEVAVEEQRKALLAQGDKDLALNGSTQDILDSMSEEEQKALKDDAKSMEDFAKDQGKMTQSLIDKLGVLVDFVMNQIYNAMLGIWEGIMNIPGVGDEETKKRIAQIKAAREGGAAKNELVSVASKGGDVKGGLAKTALASAIGKAASTFATTNSNRDDIEAKYTSLAERKSSDPSKWTDADEKALVAAESQLRAADSSQKAFDDMKKAMMENMSSKSMGEAMKAAGMGGGEGDTSSKLFKYMSYRSTHAGAVDDKAMMADALKHAGITEEEMAKVMEKVPWIEDSTEALKTMTAMTPALEETGYYEEAKATAEATKASAESSAHLDEKATKDGTLYVKYSTKFLKGDYKKVVKEAVLDAARTALFEYWMYSEMDRGQVADLMRESNLSVEDFARPFSEQIGTGDELYGNMSTGEVGAGGEPNQHGGLVTHVRDGLAVVQPPPPGEGYAAIGPGEEIRPAYARGRGGGGGTTNVHITLDPNAQRLIRAQVMDGIYEYKQRERNS